MGWRVIDCSELIGKLGYRRGQLLVTREDAEPTIIPLADIAVVLVGNRVSFSAAAIQRLAEEDVAVLFTDWRGVPLAAAHSWGHHTRIGARQIKQAGVSLPRKKSLWADMVRAKVRGQAAVLAALERPSGKYLKKLSTEVRSGDPTNVEAQAAARYWKNLFIDTGFVRDPGVGSEPNSYLDYGYSILRGAGIRAVVAAGLSPTLGVFHKGRSNAFNLVDDLIEPFRPVVDQIVALLPSSSSMSDVDTRRSLVSCLKQPFSPSGHTVATEFENLAQRVGMYFEGDIKSVRVHSWHGNLAVDENH